LASQRSAGTAEEEDKEEEETRRIDYNEEEKEDKEKNEEEKISEEEITRGATSPVPRACGVTINGTAAAQLSGLTDILYQAE
jgi:hypothetical protein